MSNETSPFEIPGSPEGLDAEQLAKRAARELAAKSPDNDGAVETFESVVDAIVGGADPQRAFDLVALDDAIALELSDPAAHAAACSRLFATMKERAAPGLGKIAWEKARDARRREQKRAQRAAEIAAQKSEKSERAQAIESAREAELATVQAWTTEHPELAAHMGERWIDGRRFVMRPGSTRVEEYAGREVIRTTLLTASCVITQQFRSFDNPSATPSYVYRVELLTDGSTRPLVVEVPAEEFAGFQWVASRLGSNVSARTTSRERSDLAAAVHAFSHGVTKTSTRFGFVGYHEFEGRLVYSHHGGAIGAGELDVAGDLPASSGLDKFTLIVPKTRGEAREAIRASLECLSIEPAAVAVPLFAAVYRSALGGSSVTVHLDARPQVGKTLLVSLAQRHFGAGMHAKALPGQWQQGSTAALLELMARVGDAVLVFDDYKASSSSSKSESMRDKFEQVTRACFNRSTVRRLQRTGRARASFDPRCVLLSTGEDTPIDESMRSRIVLVRLSKRVDADLEPLSKRAAAGLYARAIGGFISWAIENEIPGENMRREDAKFARELLDRGMPDRTAGLFGELLSGVAAFLTFAQHCGAITDAEHDAHLERAREALANKALDQGVIADEVDPINLFFSALSNAIFSGRAHIANSAGSVPPPVGAPEQWGWIPDRSSPGHWTPAGARVGAFSPSARDEIGLEVEAALSVANAIAKSNGDTLSLSARTLGRRLYESGRLARHSMDRSPPSPLARVRFRDGGRRWMLVVPTSALIELEDAAQQPQDTTQSDTDSQPLFTD